MEKKLRIHIEGMGIQGCLLANFLELRGIEFTWHDLDVEQTAWKASTGAIYPANSTKFGDDAGCHEMWGHWIQQGLVDCVEVCSFWFNHKSCEPHNGKFGIQGSQTNVNGSLRMSRGPAYHFNAQKFVPETRERFANNRVLTTRRIPEHDLYVVSHGWGLRQGHVYWGWTRLVELIYDKPMFDQDGNRASFYFRDGRFIMAYAYPVPGTPYWYAGSHIIKQSTSKARSLEMEPKYEKWKENFERLSHGMVTVGKEHEFIEGWRPACRDDAWAQRSGNKIELRPLWNSGIRHFPQQLSEFGKVAGIPEFELELK